MTETLIKKYSLQKFVRGSTTSEGLIVKLDELINSATLGIEQPARRKLLDEKAALSFPELDTSFLSMRGKTLHIRHGYDFDRYDLAIVVPRFAVFSVDNLHERGV